MLGVVSYDAHADLIIGARQEQQDTVRLLTLPSPNGPDQLLMVVADGMGGHEGGAVASGLAVDAFEKAMAGPTGGDNGERLAQALEMANAAIGDAVRQNSELRGMGCTLVAAILSGRQVQWISVGDSILVEIANGGVHRLNADHSFAPLLDAQVARGEITAQEARESDQRHILRSALTGGPIALIDEGCRGLTAGALLVAASDGVHTLDDSLLGSTWEDTENPTDFVSAVLTEITKYMLPDQDNTAIAAARLPGTMTRRIETQSIGMRITVFRDIYLKVVKLAIFIFIMMRRFLSNLLRR